MKYSPAPYVLCPLVPSPFLSIQSTSTRPSPTHSSSLKSLKFFSFNARSLFPKFDEFRLSVSSLDPDIICICETWLTNDIQNSEISLPGYSLFRKDSLHKIGGGVAIYAKSNLSSSLIKLSSSLEFILISIFHLNVKLFIGCFYRPPSSPNDTSFLLDLLSSSSINFSNNLFLFGDFNHNTLSSTPNPVSSLLDHFSLDQIIQSPTRFSSTGTPTILDLALIPNSSSSTYSILPPVSTSDHLSILVSVLHQTPSAYIIKLILKKSTCLYPLPPGIPC